MAQGAPKGNKFWEQRATHGRGMLFSSPTLLWEACTEYFAWCEDNPLIAQEAKVVSNGMNAGSSVEMVDLERMRPFTLMGLCLFLDCNTKYFNDLESSLKGKEDEDSKGFSEVITRVREIIYTQKYTGAATGFFNANIIARDLGLSDKQDITNNTITVEIKEE